ncbi:MAG: hypothetical protein JSU87_15065 [Gemmatimonadota bacterium]|nr:MAG: hypothetical protein JSU87_15065 [Gemmatimonadota bacterium]
MSEATAPDNAYLGKGIRFPPKSLIRLALLPAFLLNAAPLPGVPEGAPHPPPTRLCATADSVFSEREISKLRVLIDPGDSQHGAAAATHARAAIAALHLGRLTRNTDYYGLAYESLKRAEEAYRDDPCFLYYRGIVRRQLGSRAFFAAEVWARLRDRDNVELAAQDFRRAAQLEPAWLAPAAALADMSINALEGRAGRRQRWQEWATAALAPHAGEPEAALWSGRLLMEADSFEAALAAFSRYALASNSGLAQLELARALFALERADEATQAYWTAVAALAYSDSALVAELDRDLRYIFDPQEAEEWYQLMTGERRADWVRRFWARRAARDLVPEDERLPEHYARLRHALGGYRRISEAEARLSGDAGRVGPPARALDVPLETGYVGGDDLLLDDRGLTYVRMGEPDEVVPCLGQGSQYQSWIYPGTDGRPFALHFAPPRGVDDWVIVTTLPISCYERLGSVSTYYNSLAWRMAQGGLRARELRIRERNRSEAFVREVMASDRHILPLDWELEFGYEWLFFRGLRPGTIDVTLSYSVPARSLECERTDERQECRLQVRATIFDRDTVLAWLDASGAVGLIDEGGWLMGHAGGGAAPGSWDYRVAAFEPRHGDADDKLRGNAIAGRVVVPALGDPADRSAVSLSSLVLARPEPGTWRRSGQSLSLNPTHVYPADASVDLYYEIYGIPERDSYETEIILLKADNPPMAALDPPAEWLERVLSDPRPELELRFEEGAGREGRPWAARRKTLSLTGIDSGLYVLVLSITPDRSATTVHRVTPLIIE